MNYIKEITEKNDQILEHLYQLPGLEDVPILYMFVKFCLNSEVKKLKEIIDNIEKGVIPYVNYFRCAAEYMVNCIENEEYENLSSECIRVEKHLEEIREGKIRKKKQFFIVEDVQRDEEKKGRFIAKNVRERDMEGIPILRL